MDDKSFAVRYLEAGEKAHEGYFMINTLKILDVTLDGLLTVNVHIIKPDLPFEIKHDIEAMFWIS